MEIWAKDFNRHLTKGEIQGTNISKHEKVLNCIGHQVNTNQEHNKIHYMFSILAKNKNRQQFLGGIQSNRNSQSVWGNGQNLPKKIRIF